MLDDLNRTEKQSDEPDGLRSKAERDLDSAISGRRLATVKQMLASKRYGWATNSFLRHVIFNAEDRVGSGGAIIKGNGLAPAIIRVGRKILIDLDEFDKWIEGHRMADL